MLPFFTIISAACLQIGVIYFAFKKINSKPLRKKELI
jgi:hypothetical protein